MTRGWFPFQQLFITPPFLLFVSIIHLNMSSDGKEPLDGGDNEPRRYCFRVQVDDIPGVPEARALTLVNRFMLERFARRFSWELDYVYAPANIDGSGKAWVLLDVGKDATTTSSLDQIRLDVFKVKIEGEQ